MQVITVFCVKFYVKSQVCETDDTNQWTLLRILARFDPRLLIERDRVHFRDVSTQSDNSG